VDFPRLTSASTLAQGLAMHDLMAQALDELRSLPLLSVACVEGAAMVRQRPSFLSSWKPPALHTCAHGLFLV
jgi:hypothetical protein